MLKKISEISNKKGEKFSYCVLDLLCVNGARVNDKDRLFKLQTDILNNGHRYKIIANGHS